MNTCQNCGKINTPENQFCRFCGTRFGQPLPAAASDPYNFASPRPYAWKTDEYPTNTEARRTMPGMPESGPTDLQHSQFHAVPFVHSPAQPLAQPFRCPSCMSVYPPRTERRISTAGWITFAVLLVFFFPLFWIGLLIKEDVIICQACNTKLT